MTYNFIQIYYLLTTVSTSSICIVQYLDIYHIVYKGDYNSSRIMQVGLVTPGVASRGLSLVPTVSLALLPVIQIQVPSFNYLIRGS